MPIPKDRPLWWRVRSWLTWTSAEELIEDRHPWSQRLFRRILR